MSDRQFPCSSCGANLLFAPGQQALNCPYCDSANEIAVSDIPVVENDFHQKLTELEKHPGKDDVIEVCEIKCDACGAEFSITPGETAGECAYCATPFVLEPHTDVILKPQALLPFKITSKDGMQEFRAWVSKLWFAPNKLKEYARTSEKLKGIYLAHWTYDSNTVTSYMGSRGEHYYVTEHYTDSEGKSRTRQVRKTRWYPASGIVTVNFDDILVVANDSLPRKYTEKLEPWDLENVVPYTEEYLSGFSSERYSVGLAEGFDMAKDQVDNVLVRTIKRDIGGDEQRIHSRYTDWNNVTYKHVLLPVWVTAYRYDKKVFRVVINARTGEVQGERPWSWVKIILTALLVIAVIVGIVILCNR
jgi:DNA-directed RNA polymerase subunit RPC12/RpoP